MGLLAGCRGGRAVFKNPANIGDGDVGRMAGIGCWNETQLDPPPQRILDDFVASVSQVAMDLPNRSRLKSCRNHSKFPLNMMIN